MAGMIVIEQLSIGTPVTSTDARGVWRSAIFRQAVVGPVQLTMAGHVGDKVADTENHGSPDQAVCCHPISHYAAWNAEYGLSGEQALGPGSVGENWTLSGVDEQSVCIGDTFQVGTARVQVSGPRYPCTKQDRKLGIEGFQQRTLATRRTGFYLRVIIPGVVMVSNTLTLIRRPHPSLTIAAICENGLGQYDPAFGEQALAAPELMALWKKILHMKAKDS
jgi:MOSC domain-containing protein YiiM